MRKGGDKDQAHDDLRQNLQEWGADEDAIDKFCEEQILGDDPGDAPFEIWPENVRLLRLFVEARRCWRIGPLGGIQGFDYPNLEARCRLMKVKDAPQTIAFLEAMLDAAAPILTARHD